MKTQIFSIVLFCSLLVGSFGYTWQPFELECVDKLEIEKTTIEDLNRPMDKPSPEDNDVLNKFIECAGKKDKILHENGEVNWNRIKEKFADISETMHGTLYTDIVTTVIKTCEGKNFQGTSPGQTLVKVQNCFGTNIREKKQELIEKHHL